MSNRPERAAPTREHRPPTEEHEELGRPVLLAAFPQQVMVPLPAPSAIVGYDWLADAGVADEEVSAQHLRFHRMRGRLEIEDVGSTNGTFLNGHRLVPRERSPLEDGSVLRLGTTLLVYREAFTGPDKPQASLGRLAGPWGLGELREEVARLKGRAVRNVLLLGESGTGKQLLAEEIARVLGRDHPATGDGPLAKVRPRFVEINVAGIPEDRMEAELFGWEKGAFTGGQQMHPGIFRACHGGAVFLDEIGELPLALQPKLLRLLENHQVQPLGALGPTQVDVVILAATNQELDEQVKAGRFRLDLLARFPIRLSLPALDERPEDLFAILAELYSRAHGKLDPAAVRVEVIELLMLHDWPANVRDLDRLIQAVDPRMGLKLPLVRRVLAIESARKAPPLTPTSILAALTKHGGNRTHAAKELGVKRPRLLRAIKKHKLAGGTSG